MCSQRLLTWFWNRIYDGIDVFGIEHVKQLAETATLVYVPSHRSHVDYLLLSYLLYDHGLMIPHIAAGDNLDMPAHRFDYCGAAARSSCGAAFATTACMRPCSPSTCIS